MRTREELLAACERALGEGTPEERQARSRAMLSETWDARVAELGRHVLAAEDRRGLRRAA